MSKQKIRESANTQHPKKPATGHNKLIAVEIIPNKELEAMLSNIKKLNERASSVNLNINTTSLFSTNENAVPHKNVVEPLSRAKFSQNHFIKTVNEKYCPAPSSPSLLNYLWKTPNTPVLLLNSEGICATLVLLWYKGLRSGSNIVDTYTEELPEEHFIRYLSKTHGSLSLGYYKLPQTIIDKYNIKIKPDLDPQDMFNKLGFLGSENAQAENTLCDPDKDQIIQLQEYFQKLETTDKECVGLHLISFAFEKDEQIKGHVFGWSATDEENYLLFDPNFGEILFKDYQDLTNYVCNEYFVEYGLNNFWISTENFYFEEDLEALDKCGSTFKFTH